MRVGGPNRPKDGVDRVRVAGMPDWWETGPDLGDDRPADLDLSRPTYGIRAQGVSSLVLGEHDAGP